ncbi:BQ5605_C001g00628 [Microbotryum silenes-dioicae]|uniref:BQ5605_C001g00628 protein n=1 Tax=Microbotryum silenes-dioicae TaxID=796604 RepID=A0A2X0M804_9BASI|nr:BQ5605_C001g00628 [Microbotryum silenes-dioicae]
MRSKIGDFPGFYLRASGWVFMGPVSGGLWQSQAVRRSAPKCAAGRCAGDAGTGDS